VFYFEKMEVNDFRNDVLLAEACRADVDKLCKHVEPGAPPAPARRAPAARRTSFVRARRAGRLRRSAPLRHTSARRNPDEQPVSICPTVVQISFGIIRTSPKAGPTSPMRDAAPLEALGACQAGALGRGSG